MADLTVTSTNVVPGSNARYSRYKAGEAITAGQTVYKNVNDSKVYKFDADAAGKGTLLGLAVNTANADSPVDVQDAGECAMGSILTVGVVYVGSDTAGGIMPVADLETGDVVNILGVGKTATTLLIGINATGVTFA